MNSFKNYLRLPTVIEAIQWTGDNLKQIIDEIGLHESVKNMSWKEYCELVKKEGLKIFTVEGSLTCPIGNWVIKGHSKKLGFHYLPVDPDYFKENYIPY